MAVRSLEIQELTVRFVEMMKGGGASPDWCNAASSRACPARNWQIERLKVVLPLLPSAYLIPTNGEHLMDTRFQLTRLLRHAFTIQKLFFLRLQQRVQRLMGGKLAISLGVGLSKTVFYLISTCSEWSRRCQVTSGSAIIHPPSACSLLMK